MGRSWGAQILARLPDPGDGFVTSHPADADRQAEVAQTNARITARKKGDWSAAP